MYSLKFTKTFKMTTNQNIATSVITSSMCLLGYQVVVFLIEVFQFYNVFIKIYKEIQDDHKPEYCNISYNQ